MFVPIDAMRDELQALTGLQPPKIVVIGNESAGKSTLLESLIGFPLFPRGTEFCTRIAIHVRLRRPASADVLPSVKMSVWSVEDLALAAAPASPPLKAGAIWDNEPTPHKFEDIPISDGYSFVGHKMRELVSEIIRSGGQRSGVVTDKAIVLDVIHPEVPVLDLVDLPGRVQVDVPQYPGKKAAIHEIYQKQVEMDKEAQAAIYLVVVPSPTPTGDRPNNNEALQFIMQNELQTRAIGVFTKADGSDPAQLRQYITTTCSHMGGVSLKEKWVSTMLRTPANHAELNGLERLQVMENDERTFYGAPAPGSMALRDLYDGGQAGVPALATRLMSKYHQHIRTTWLEGALSRLCGVELDLRFRHALTGKHDNDEAIGMTMTRLETAALACHEAFIRDIVIGKLQPGLALLAARSAVGRGELAEDPPAPLSAGGTVQRHAMPTAWLPAAFTPGRKSRGRPPSAESPSVVAKDVLEPMLTICLKGDLTEWGEQMKSLVACFLTAHLCRSFEEAVKDELCVRVEARDIETFRRATHEDHSDLPNERKIFDQLCHENDIIYYKRRCPSCTFVDFISANYSENVATREDGTIKLDPRVMGQGWLGAWERLSAKDAPHAIPKESPSDNDTLLRITAASRPYCPGEVDASTAKKMLDLIDKPPVQLAHFPNYIAAVGQAIKSECKAAEIRIVAETSKIIDQCFSPCSPFLRYKPLPDGKRIQVAWRYGTPECFVDSIITAIICDLPTPIDLSGAIRRMDLRLSSFGESIETTKARSDFDARISLVQRKTEELVKAIAGGRQAVEQEGMERVQSVKRDPSVLAQGLNAVRARPVKWHVEHAASSRRTSVAGTSTDPLPAPLIQFE